MGDLARYWADGDLWFERWPVPGEFLSSPEIVIISGCPVRGTPEAESGLAVTVDRHKLLEKLVAQLNGLEYVDYAQPNATVQFMK